MPQDAIPHIPGAVLTAHVFPFVGVKTLSKCAQVCKEWRDAADQDVLWKVHCARKWATKKNVPRVVFKQGPFLSEIEKAGEAVSLFPFARYGERTELKIKDMQQVLAARGIDYSAFLEREQFVKAILATQPRDICGWRGEPKSKWKASYIGAAFAAMRRTITRGELTGSTWTLSFKSHGINGGEVYFISPLILILNNTQTPQTWTAQFQPDGKYTSRPHFNHPDGALEWKFVSGSGNNFDAVQVGSYPYLTVGRTPDWGYTLENDYVIFHQVKQ